MSSLRIEHGPSPAAPAGDGAPVRFNRPPGFSVISLLGDWGLAMPLILVAGTVLLVPCFAMILSSFSAADGSLTLKNWSDTFASKTAVDAITGSLLLGFTVATIAAAVGIPLSLMIARMPGLGRSINMGILNVASHFGGIGLGFGFIAALGTYGMVTLSLNALGIPFVPPKQNAFWGLVIAYEYSNIPLFVILTLPAVAALRNEWWEAAQTASASRLQFWRHIGLPILGPFFIGSWLLIFTWAVGLYGLPVALNGSAPGSFRLITLEMAKSLTGSFFGKNYMPVYAVVLMISAGVTLGLYQIILRRGTRWLK
ncbi:hypothetical protein HHL25_07060 [Rhizobium sp. S-51]|uniref:ABC transmembrane type-1 domain-containing protein n=1 Tax=Rhizobium terricola TaxID=2728849 RepID=A0A7Y0AUT9_9HYPH|nr:hypothetical protein [Rhizobium terricola]NML73881.1 hypothetical protein [Rhizobium terricola]